MFSSRIIKNGVRERLPLDEFFFGALQEGGSPPHQPAGEGFQPLVPNGHSAADEFIHQQNTRQTQQGEAPDTNLNSDEDEFQLLLQESYDSGFAKGRQETEESLAGICRTLSEAITEVSGLREHLVRECEDDLLRLAMMVAKQIIRQEITLDRKILAQFVCEATTGIIDLHDIVICFNPEDYELVSADRSFYLAGINDKMQVTIKPDDAVTIGGCIVETQTGLVDASVETQLANVFKRLMQENGHGSDDSLEQHVVDGKQNPAEQYGVKKHGSH